jgi:hypothetical protein
MDPSRTKAAKQITRLTIEQLAANPKVLQTCSGPVKVSIDHKRGRKLKVKIESPELPEGGSAVE